MDGTDDSSTSRISLCDALDRLLNTGVVAHGDLTISVAGVELLYVGIRGLLCAVDALDRKPQSLNSAVCEPSVQRGLTE